MLGPPYWIPELSAAPFTQASCPWRPAEMRDPGCPLCDGIVESVMDKNIPDLIPPAELLCDSPSSEYMDLLVAQIGHLERKSRGLLSGFVRAFGGKGFVRFQFLATIPKVGGFEIVLFSIDRDPSRASGHEDVEEVRAKFLDADVVRALRNMYSIARSTPDPADDQKYEPAEG